MESLSSTHSDGYWSIDQNELVPTSSAFTIPRTKLKNSDYDTGFSAAEYDEDSEQSKKTPTGRVKKVRLQGCFKTIVWMARVVCCSSSYMHD